MALPIPREPPVIRAVFPCMSNISIFLFRVVKNTTFQIAQNSHRVQRPSFSMTLLAIPRKKRQGLKGTGLRENGATKPEP
jgi:hypothetical protein